MLAAGAARGSAGCCNCGDAHNGLDLTVDEEGLKCGYVSLPQVAPAHDDVQILPGVWDVLDVVAVVCKGEVGRVGGVSCVWVPGRALAGRAILHGKVLGARDREQRARRIDERRVVLQAADVRRHERAGEEGVFAGHLLRAAPAGVVHLERGGVDGG